MSPLLPRQKRPAYLERIEPHDFKAVAEQGCFVYCYLRTTTGTPYYIGIAKHWKRPLGKHNTAVPKERHRIRILRSGLTWEEACAWEIHYITRWGRRDNSTGILHNRTDGGDGAPGVIVSPRTRAKLSTVLKNRIFTPEHRANISSGLQGRTYKPQTLAKMSAAKKGKPSPWKGKTPTPEARARMSAAKKGKTLAPEHIAKMVATRKGYTHAPETRAKISAANKNRTLTPEHRAKLSAAKIGRTLSPETRTKMSEAGKLRCARIKHEQQALQLLASIA